MVKWPQSSNTWSIRLWNRIVCNLR